MLFDTHAHYDDRRFNADRDAVIASLPSLGVQYVTNIGADLESSRTTAALAEKYPFMYGAAGFHPHEAKSMTDEAFGEIGALLRKPKMVAWGEIGLDYHYDFSPREVQREVFRRQLEAARDMQIPFIIHEREAARDTLYIIKSVGYYDGVFHCYSGSVETAKELLTLGLHLSFTGVITFKNAIKPLEVIKYAPLDRLMVETDCPYMAPTPMRGERNFSGYLKYTAQAMAACKGVEYDELCRITTQNALRFYRIQP